MRFFAKIVFVFNLCFLATIPLRFYELHYKTNHPDQPFTGAIPVKPLESLLVILGYSAIFVNIIFVILVLVTGKIKSIPKWLFWVNASLLIVQLYYFFFSSF